jgi:hypothetical protein
MLKKHLLLAVLTLFAFDLNAQYITPVKYVGSPYTAPINYFNTAGARVKKFSTTVVDTLVSQIFTNDWDVADYSFAATSPTDTIRANLFYQAIYGGIEDSGKVALTRMKGWYRIGAGAMSAIQDSINSLGQWGPGTTGTTKTYVGVKIPMDVFSGNTQTTLAAGLQDSRDSTRTVTYTYNTVVKGVVGFRIVLISQGGSQDATNSTLLDNSLIIFRRKQNSNQ